MLKSRSKTLGNIKSECFINGVCYRCRTCFDPVRSVYSLKEECSKTNSWRELLREFPQLQTNAEELLPNSVCSKCLDKVSKCYDFILQINNANKKYLELLGVTKESTFESNCLTESSIDLPMDHTFLSEIKIEKEEIDSDQSNYFLSIIKDDDNNSTDNVNKISMEFGSSSSSDEWDDTLDTSKQVNDESDFGEIQKVNGRFICPVCNKSYLSKQNCRRHLHCSHLKRDNFPCGFCETQFVCKDYLCAHLKRMHPGETLDSNAKQMSETQTDHGVKNDQELESEHIKQDTSSMDSTNKAKQKSSRKNVDSNANSKALCPFCGAIFSSNHNLDFHIRIHTGERRFKCDFCVKAFTRNADLKEHRLIHTGERPHKCTLCKKAFTTASKLKVHKRLHTGDYPYKCSFCEKSFNTLESYKPHVRLHTGEKPYKCEMCYEAFVSPRYLKQHRIKYGHFVEKQNDF